MMLKKWTRVFGVVSVVAMAPAAMASSPKLDCPAGTRQAGGMEQGKDIVMCVRTSDGKPHGPSIWLHPNGAKQAEGRTENGFREGLWTFFDEKGNKTGTAELKGGNFHGEVVELHSNGKVKKVERYVHNSREGAVEEFSADGKLVKKSEWRNNREVAAR
ncbi:toxin-antitoxin system YwqK family antitoxin [Pyxidicoccus sp. 3LG]